MNTQEINRILSTNRITKNFYRGAYPADANFNFKPPYCVVMNCDSHNGPGSHWTGWFVTKTTIFFFDSMGRSPRDQTLPRDFGLFLKNKSKKVVYNHKIVEGIFSTTCGHFSIYVLFRLCKGDNWTNIMNSFNADTKVNDRKVRQFVCRLRKM